ncbi:MAG: hypothetical protein WBB45_12695 [Cyclobacteriaceae bacterium]
MKENKRSRTSLRALNIKSFITEQDKLRGGAEDKTKNHTDVTCTVCSYI